jgi:DNA-binding IclR family transcriptional regulator
LNENQVTVGKGERIILTAVAQYPEGASREQLTILTGYRRSSRDTYLQRLFSRDLVANNGRGNIVATEAGVHLLGPDFEPLPTGEDLQAYWLNRLTGGERTLLEALIRAYPKAVEREALSEATEYKRSSRDTYLQRLTARRLVDTVGRGEVRASEELFG